MVRAGTGLCIPGNHDVKLVRKLRGKEVKINHGLEATLAEFEALPAEPREASKSEVAGFLGSLVSHYVLDSGKLVLAHAGLREFALYGETTGETDEFGLPIRYNWAAEYRGDALVVYGHTPVPEPLWLNHTVNLDTGCVFGGALTALRYPELETVGVPAAKTYAEPVRPLEPATKIIPQQADDNLLDLEDVIGKRIITTRLRKNVIIREAQSIAALETLSRYTVDPKWLVYLPPTMAAPTTSSRDGLLEHPDEAVDYYRKEGVTSLVCQEKHMGSRAVVIICRDNAAAKARFGVSSEDPGTVYTRTDRLFFTDSDLQRALLTQLQNALHEANFWNDFATDWAVFDAELMPWSHKAQVLLEQQYAPTGASAQHTLELSLEALDSAQRRGQDTRMLLRQFAKRLQEVQRYTRAYRRYCWPVDNVTDLKLALFQLLATEGSVYTERSHVWHLEAVRRYLGNALSVVPTAFRELDLRESDAVGAVISWWEELTQAGGEGMVVKPAFPVTQGKRGVVQPGIKVRGQNYLRIIYGPEYLLPENLERLRPRNVSTKRSLALQEFALGLEALERFVKKVPLREVHECIVGILALENEGLDPRL